MFNSFNFNTTVFNGLGGGGNGGGGSALMFNAFDLQSSEVITQRLIQDNTPVRDFDTVAVPRGDGEILTGDFWRKKTVKIKGILKKSTNEELEALIDSMKKALAVAEGNLDIKVAGVYRRYKASLSTGNSMFEDRQGYHITFCPFEAEFVCLEPYAKSINYNSMGGFGITDLIFEDSVNNGGTVRAKPVIILNIIAASGITAISFRNNTTGEEIKLTQSINPGDLITFDSEALAVILNGANQDYTGSFPILETDDNSFTIEATGASIEYDLTVKHKTTYL